MGNGDLKNARAEELPQKIGLDVLGEFALRFRFASIRQFGFFSTKENNRAVCKYFEIFPNLCNNLVDLLISKQCQNFNQSALVVVKFSGITVNK